MPVSKMLLKYTINQSSRHIHVTTNIENNDIPRRIKPMADIANIKMTKLIDYK